MRLSTNELRVKDNNKRVRGVCVCVCRIGGGHIDIVLFMKFYFSVRWVRSWSGKLRCFSYPRFGVFWPTCEPMCCDLHVRWWLFISSWVATFAGTRNSVRNVLNDDDVQCPRISPSFIFGQWSSKKICEQRDEVLFFFHPSSILLMVICLHIIQLNQVDVCTRHRPRHSLKNIQSAMQPTSIITLFNWNRK